MPKLECVRGQGFYIMGLYLSQGYWVWPDNESLGNYTNWKTEKGSVCKLEPNGHKGMCFHTNEERRQNSTQINGCGDGTFFGKWFDKHELTSNWYYICERPYVPLRSSPTTSKLKYR